MVVLEQIGTRWTQVVMRSNPVTNIWVWHHLIDSAKQFASGLVRMHMSTDIQSHESRLLSAINATSCDAAGFLNKQQKYDAYISIYGHSQSPSHSC